MKFYEILFSCKQEKFEDTISLFVMLIVSMEKVAILKIPRHGWNHHALNK
jgi:imidazoleglycerol phosphate synthase glutamine amidotransferase subunit HisH